MITKQTVPHIHEQGGIRWKFFDGTKNAVFVQCNWCEKKLAPSEWQLYEAGVKDALHYQHSEHHPK